MFLAEDIDRFYLDLKDPRFVSAVAIYHQRYSTNTFPQWRLAQPFRMLAHNGEINTVSGNINWMQQPRDQDGLGQLWRVWRRRETCRPARTARTRPRSTTCSNSSSAPAARARWPRRCWSPKPGRSAKTSCRARIRRSMPTPTRSWSLGTAPRRSPCSTAAGRSPAWTATACARCAMRSPTTACWRSAPKPACARSTAKPSCARAASAPAGMIAVDVEEGKFYRPRRNHRLAGVETAL